MKCFREEVLAQLEQSSANDNEQKVYDLFFYQIANTTTATIDKQLNNDFTTQCLQFIALITFIYVYLDIK